MERIKLQNIPSGADGSGYLILNGEVLPAFLIVKVSAQLDVSKETKRFLGQRMSQSVVRGMAGTGNLSYHHTTAAFMRAMKEYQNGGAYPAITLQYWSENSERGRCEVTLREVILDTVGFGALDDSSEGSQVLETAFSFNDYDVVEGF